MSQASSRCGEAWERTLLLFVLFLFRCIHFAGLQAMWIPGKHTCVTRTILKQCEALAEQHEQGHLWQQQGGVHSLTSLFDVMSLQQCCY